MAAMPPLPPIERSTVTRRLSARAGSDKRRSAYCASRGPCRGEELRTQFRLDWEVGERGSRRLGRGNANDSEDQTGRFPMGLERWSMSYQLRMSGTASRTNLIAAHKPVSVSKMSPRPRSSRVARRGEERTTELLVTAVDSNPYCATTRSTFLQARGDISCAS